MAFSDWFEVESSNVDAIAYDDETSTLAVRFKGDSVYHYMEVPEDVFEEFKVAVSKGKFLHREIKGVYEYERVE